VHLEETHILPRSGGEQMPINRQLAPSPEAILYHIGRIFARIFSNSAHHSVNFSHFENGDSSYLFVSTNFIQVELMGRSNDIDEKDWLTPLQHPHYSYEKMIKNACRLSSANGKGRRVAGKATRGGKYREESSTAAKASN